MMRPFKHLVLYDGTCELCHALVRFILKRDKKELFAFAPLQGKTAQELFKSLLKTYSHLDSVFLLENYQTDRRVWVKGKASLRILSLLGGWLSPLSWMVYLPACVVNPLYGWIAKRRFRLFGKKECLLPDPHHPDRFLE